MAYVFFQKRVMQVLRKLSELREFCQNQKLAFVPTMGYLHEGHLSLIRKAKNLCDKVLVSLFVNPLQFNNPDDLQNYPRNEERDFGFLEKEQVTAVFSPSVDEIYPQGYPKIRIWHPLMEELCGKFRPGHFEGVLYIVHNLFQWIKPSYALFGKKDYQQLLLVKAMVKELAFDLQIIECPTIRDKDGLALSSRNARLSPKGRILARKIPESLYLAYQKSKKMAKVKEINEFLHENFKDLKVDYAGVFNPKTLKPSAEESLAWEGLLAVAVHVENVRLIDNLLLSDEEAFLYLGNLLRENLTCPIDVLG